MQQIKLGATVPLLTVRSGEIVANSLAPHTGHVSNSCGLNRTVIEPVDGHCFQGDPCELLAGVHGGHPVRTRLELSNSPRDPVISGCVVIRPQTARIAPPFATRRDLSSSFRDILASEQ